MAEIITEANLASYLQVDIPAGKADLQIELANGLVSDKIGDYLGEPPYPTDVRAVTLEVAARGYRNPEALTSETKSIDDFTTTKRREGVAAQKAGIYLTDDDVTRLRRAVGLTTKKAPRSVRIGVPGYTA